MKTKFDIGEKVLVEATVKSIEIEFNGTIIYRLDNENWTNIERFKEDEILSLNQLKEVLGQNK